MQADSYKRLTTLNCDRCGKEYEPTLNKDGSIRKRNFKACSQWCQVALSKGIPKAQCSRLDKAPCEHCGTLFKPKKEPYGRALFCSRDCFNSYDGIKNPTQRLDVEFRFLRDQAAIGKKEIKIILGMVLLKDIARTIDIERKGAHDRIGELTTCQCDRCEVLFKAEVTGGRPPKYCKICRSNVIAEQKRVSHHLAKAKRRLRCRGSAYQPVDPIKVFNRDKWKCHICGTSTPKELRGSYLGNAPELDHIVTLADGGSHTYGNVACACRSCNQKKGARSCGQLKFF